MCEFSDVLRRLCEEKPYIQALQKNLLLGNGYSIAACDLFNYKELFEMADFSTMPQVRCIFETYGTINFEYVLEVLGHAERVADCLPPPAQMPTVADCREWLINEFIHTLERVHPDNMFNYGALTCIDEDMYARNGRFLRLFNNIFTLNYDLILYRSILQNNLEGIFKDCFRGYDDGLLVFSPDISCVPHIFYLHGALHLRKSPENMAYKVRYTPHYNLLAKLHDHLQQNIYPILVFEGRDQEKVKTINNDAYLTYINQIFANITGMLVTFGFSFGNNDAHIINSIINSGVSYLLVGAHGNVTSDMQMTLNNILLLANQRHQVGARTCPLTIDIYDTSAVRIW